MTSDNYQDRVLQALDTIITLLKPIHAVASQQVHEIIATQFLTTDQRRVMYDLFDGKHSLADIAEAVGVSSEAVRLLATEMAEEGLLEMIPVGRTKNPKKLFG